VLAAAGVVELVHAGDLPGKGVLDHLDGACSVHGPKETYAPSGPTVTGHFFSHARGITVGYTLAYPPAHGPGDQLPLVLYLYGDGGDHESPLGGIAPARALAGHVRSGGLPPMAIGVVDGGGLYWNAHPGDDPMRMLTDEFFPLCKKHGLGSSSHGIGALGISMGGYGALLLAEKHPDLVSAVAAISPAIWTTYDQADAVNSQAFADAAAFASNDVITHASRLAGVPIRIVSGSDDPFHPGVTTLAERLPASAQVQISPGCHDDSYFSQQQLPSLQFLARHIAIA
jgi:pimeloyl-ACP methyl ester carboxylesterase